MIGVVDAIGRHLLLRLDPELAHHLAVKALACVPVVQPRADDPRLAVEAFGLVFANPVGFAAGFDKNGEAPGQILSLGFGFTEIGTVTPRAQPGNPRPRAFRLKDDRAIINRYGFNSAGHSPAMRKLKHLRDRHGAAFGAAHRHIAVNLGANKDSTDRVADYVAGINAFAALADIFVINISSPNTPGLRDLQRDHTLEDLLARLIDARDQCAARTGRVPLVVKIAPDLTEGELDSLIRTCRARAVDGLIISNTTLARPASLQDQATAKESGGLSGRPLFDMATRVLAQAYLRVEGQFPLIGAGGIDSPERAIAKIEAGASLIQVYSGLVYEGLGLLGKIKRGLLASLENGPYSRLSEATGRTAADWAAGKVTSANFR